MNDEKKLGWRCRHGHHKYRRVALDGNRGSSDREKRFSWTETLECWRCGNQQTIEKFDSYGYWSDFNREVEDNRLQENIRKALR